MHQHSVSRKLVIASAATIAFVIVESGVGVWAHSLALIGDAIHNFTDTLALLLAFAAVRLERRPATAEKSYGYQRAGVLTAFVNAGALVALTIYIFWEAVARLRAPQAVDSGAMLITAAIALALNSAITLWLREAGRHDINIRSAVVHMLGDAVSSAGIVVAALLIRFTGATYWDAVVSLGI